MGNLGGRGQYGIAFQEGKGNREGEPGNNMKKVEHLEPEGGMVLNIK